jgi:hypothetical protein
MCLEVILVQVLLRLPLDECNPVVTAGSLLAPVHRLQPLVLTLVEVSGLPCAVFQKLKVKVRIELVDLYPQMQYL